VIVNKIPNPSAESQGGDFPDFLKPSHIGKKPGATAVVTLTGGEVRKTDGLYGDQLMVPVRLGKTEYDWSVKLDTPNHRYLVETFGNVPKKWKGKKLTLTINKPIRMGYRPYIAVAKGQ